VGNGRAKTPVPFTRGRTTYLEKEGGFTLAQKRGQPECVPGGGEKLSGKESTYRKGDTIGFPVNTDPDSDGQGNGMRGKSRYHREQGKKKKKNYGTPKPWKKKKKTWRGSTGETATARKKEKDAP